ncbi:MAG TPA: DUF2062 domain-containing protein [Vicinamibacterales bacterium]|jgi:hypothetical protein
MIAITRALLRKWTEALLHIHDTPRRTAAAFAVGVFFGFSPFLGLHTVLALGVAFVFNLNRVAVLIGVYSNLPWIIAAWYAVTTAAGAWLLGTKLPEGFGDGVRHLFELSLFQADFWSQLAHQMRPLFWPYFVGSLLGAALLSIVAYWLTRGFIEARYKHMQEARLRTKH